MSAHVSETCNESNGSWLPLIEYSVKSGVSLSTIRRKIKANAIPFRFESGKYLIWYTENPNDPMPAHSWQTYPIASPAPRPAPAHAEAVAPVNPEPAHKAQMAQESWQSVVVEKSVQMVAEAYELALKEKEERLRMLEKRNRDLETHLAELRLLVQALEEKYEVRY